MQSLLPPGVQGQRATGAAGTQEGRTLATRRQTVKEEAEGLWWWRESKVELLALHPPSRLGSPNLLLHKSLLEMQFFWTFPPIHLPLLSRKMETGVVRREYESSRRGTGKATSHVSLE